MATCGKLSATVLARFEEYLVRDEKSEATIEKYLRDARAFQVYLAHRAVSKPLVIEYKRYLIERGYAMRSINSMLAAVNSLLRFMGREDCRVKSLKIQHKPYCAEDRELTQAEYRRLLESAGGKPRLQLVLQAICATGIRVSELRHFTVEGVRRGEITVRCKGKVRTILVPHKLRVKLLRYARARNIEHGMIFITKYGRPLDRSNIWAQMKALCRAASVQASKVCPHNLRKLFARAFYAVEHDIAKLADILGHSSINTTRIYIMSTGVEHRRRIEQLGLVL